MNDVHSQIMHPWYVPWRNGNDMPLPITLNNIQGRFYKKVGDQIEMVRMPVRAEVLTHLWESGKQ